MNSLKKWFVTVVDISETVMAEIMIAAIGFQDILNIQKKKTYEH